ncbi:uncharacterized protein LOC117282065 [Cryptotermes secundus]|uniref:uncharacterized protein LOC117282065 n=1 Tax=Cryptotermes secundus TaxID=105785 RepID=UPI001454CF8A|nr:uncharacterized protein LOC117282065 [Cryptotermes secundus]
MGSRDSDFLLSLIAYAHRMTDEFMRTIREIYDDWGILGVVMFLLILKWLNDLRLDILRQSERVVRDIRVPAAPEPRDAPNDTALHIQGRQGPPYDHQRRQDPPRGNQSQQNQGQQRPPWR